jgi:NADPH:quinone reductase
MQAIAFNSFGDHTVLELKKDFPIPEPNDNQIQIKVHAVGVNPYDGLVRAGYVPKPINFPCILGDDSAGIVTKIGKNVKNFAPGDRVFTLHSDSGTYAEYTLSQPSHTFKLPSHYTFEEGSALGVPYFTGKNIQVIIV